MSSNPRLLPWFALIFFALLALLAGTMLTSQKNGSSSVEQHNVPSLDLNNLFGVTR